jgi:hypothetical protein
MKIPPSTPTRVLRLMVTITYAAQAVAVTVAASLIWMVINMPHADPRMMHFVAAFFGGLCIMSAFSSFDATARVRRELIEMIESREQE